MRLWIFSGPGPAVHWWWAIALAESEEKAGAMVWPTLSAFLEAWPVDGMTVESRSVEVDGPVFFSTGGCGQHAMHERRVG